MAKILGYIFQNEALYQKAITHSSVGSHNYELLEFLGDKVLSLVITEFLFKKYPNDAEGLIAKKHAYLVSGSVLSELALSAQLDRVIIVSNGERKEGGHNNPSNLEDCLEALLGAIYLDSNLEIVRGIVLNLWTKFLKQIDKAVPIDPKSHLQEILQKRSMALPKYKIVKQEGLDHRPIFTVELTLNGYEPLQATAPLKKEAEKELALRMIEILEQNDAENE